MVRIIVVGKFPRANPLESQSRSNVTRGRISTYSRRPVMSDTEQVIVIASANANKVEWFHCFLVSIELYCSLMGVSAHKND